MRFSILSILVLTAAMASVLSFSMLAGWRTMSLMLASIVAVFPLLAFTGVSALGTLKIQQRIVVFVFTLLITFACFQVTAYLNQNFPQGTTWILLSMWLLQAPVIATVWFLWRGGQRSARTET